MEDMHRDEVLRTLQTVERLGPVYEVTTFSSRYRSPDGRDRDVTIEVTDRGPFVPSRWSVTAIDEDGQPAYGNPNDDLNTAILIVHWEDLDHC